jgi:integrase
MPLSDVQIRNLKPKSKPYKKSDGRGLFVYVSTTGGKFFRLSYKFHGKEQTLSIGRYPDIGLAQARDRAHEARQLVAQGVNPGMEKKLKKDAERYSFKSITEEWLEVQATKWAESTRITIESILRNHLIPHLGSYPAQKISTQQVLHALRRMEGKGLFSQAHRAARICSNIFLFAVASGLCENNPAADLSKVLKSHSIKSFPALTEPSEIRPFLLNVDAYPGSFVTVQALKLLILCFPRPAELRGAKWDEIDWEQALWTIPGHRMKKRREHLIPLSEQAIEVLKSLYPLTGPNGYIFESYHKGQPLSPAALNAAIKRMGYGDDEMCPHGCRSMASTRLHEQGWASDVIEMQLAHADRNQTRGIYNRADYLAERRRMLQSWADYLDDLRAGTTNAGGK